MCHLNMIMHFQIRQIMLKTKIHVLHVSINIQGTGNLFVKWHIQQNTSVITSNIEKVVK